MQEVIPHKHPSKVNKLFVNLSLLMMVAVASYFAWLALYTPKIIDIKSANVTTQTLKSGDVLHFNFTYCKYNDTDGIVYRELKNVDNVNAVNLPAAGTVAVKGCRTAMILVPTVQGTPSGTYWLHGDIVYQVNPFKTVHVPFDTNKFIITN